jgi:2-amino-4-hydroxy-6-hydroxymethyldihydropteridine diphosphokinase
MAKVYVGLGSNIDPEDNLRLGVGELRQRFGELELSDTYQSAAIGFAGPDFLNVVVGLESSDTPVCIHEQFEAIHRMAGRQRGGAKLSSRPLDIDLLLYDDLVLNETGLRLPRSDILEYSFVLRPFSELAPDLIHPETGLPLAEHWRAFDAASHPLTRVQLIL